MKRDLLVAERASEITAPVECRESHRLAIICHRMHDISLYSQCSAYHAAGEAQSRMHLDNRRIVVQDSWTRHWLALRARARAYPIRVVILSGAGWGRPG